MAYYRHLIILSLAVQASLVPSVEAGLVDRCRDALSQVTRWAQSSYAIEKARELSKGFNSDWAYHIWVVTNDVYLSKSKVERIFVRLDSLKVLHPFTTDIPVEKINQRAKVFSAHREEIINQGFISAAQFREWTPSATDLRVVLDDDGNYILIEGNGRVTSLRSGFEDFPGLLIEVDLYTTSNPKLTQEKLHEVMRRYGLRN